MALDLLFEDDDRIDDDYISLCKSIEKYYENFSCTPYETDPIHYGCATDPKRPRLQYQPMDEEDLFYDEAREPFEVFPYKPIKQDESDGSRPRTRFEGVKNIFDLDLPDFDELPHLAEEENDLQVLDSISVVSDAQLANPAEQPVANNSEEGPIVIPTLNSVPSPTILTDPRLTLQCQAGNEPKVPASSSPSTSTATPVTNPNSAAASVQKPSSSFIKKAIVPCQKRIKRDALILRCKYDDIPLEKIAEQLDRGIITRITGLTTPPAPHHSNLSEKEIGSDALTSAHRAKPKDREKTRQSVGSNDDRLTEQRSRPDQRRRDHHQERPEDRQHNNRSRRSRTRSPVRPRSRSREWERRRSRSPYRERRRSRSRSRSRGLQRRYTPPRRYERDQSSSPRRRYYSGQTARSRSPNDRHRSRSRSPHRRKSSSFERTSKYQRYYDYRVARVSKEDRDYSPYSDNSQYYARPSELQNLNVQSLECRHKPTDKFGYAHYRDPISQSTVANYASNSANTYTYEDQMYLTMESLYTEPLKNDQYTVRVNIHPDRRYAYDEQESCYFSNNN